LLFNLATKASISEDSTGGGFSSGMTVGAENSESGKKLRRKTPAQLCEGNRAPKVILFDLQKDVLVLRCDDPQLRDKLLSIVACARTSGLKPPPQSLYLLAFRRKFGSPPNYLPCGLG